MRGLAVLMAWLAGTASASALDLSGEWQMERQARNGRHTGTIVIDVDGYARMIGRSPIQDYAQCGHIREAGSQVEIVFTFAKGSLGYAPDHFYCSLREEALICSNDDGQGKEPQLFAIRRVGGRPPKVDRRLEDACPARSRPISRARPAADFG